MREAAHISHRYQQHTTPFKKWNHGYFPSSFSQYGCVCLRLVNASSSTTRSVEDRGRKAQGKTDCSYHRAAPTTKKRQKSAKLGWIWFEKFRQTFIKLLASELAPLSGSREPAQDLNVGYFAQHQIEQLQMDESVGLPTTG